MIEAKNVSLVYENETVALKDVNLKIMPGEIVFVTGPSGSGKTSLLKLLMGIEFPTSGSLKVSDQIMSKGESKNIQKLRRSIGPVFQEFKLIKRRTALENVMLGMRFLGISPKEYKSRAMDALKKVGLEGKMHNYVEEMSWGENQRVAIARAIARKPVLILADEPTGNLDVGNAMNILNLLVSFRDKDTTVVITTHATHLIEDWKDATYIKIDNGDVMIQKRGGLAYEERSL